MKLHTLLERIYGNGDALVITQQNSREASTKDAISTFVRRQPYETHLRGAGDAVIYSLFNYLSSPTTTNLLSSLKGRGPYKINEKQLEAFFKQVNLASTQLVHNVNPDIIIYPKSSSTLTAKFVESLSNLAPKAKILPDAFIKSLLKAEDVTPLINTSHPDWEKFAKEHPDEVKKLKHSLAHHIEEHGTLELKKLYKPYLKFIKNFIELEKANDVLDQVIGKRVLVIDDILSSGTTMIEMLRQLHELEPSYLAGLTLFKRTNQPNE